MALLKWQNQFSTIFHTKKTDFHQFSSVTQSCPTLCNPMNRSTPGLPVHYQLLEFTQTHVHRVGDSGHPQRPCFYLCLCGLPTLGTKPQGTLCFTLCSSAQTTLQMKSVALKNYRIILSFKRLACSAISFYLDYLINSSPLFFVQQFPGCQYPSI